MDFDPTAMLTEFRAMAAAVFPMLLALGLGVGFFLIGRGGYLMAFGDPQRGRDEVPFGAVVANLFIGAALITFARTVSNTQEVLGGAGTGVRAAVAYVAPSAGTSIWGLALAAAFMWVSAVGACAVFKGLLLWHELGSGGNRGGGGDQFWKGLWHILGGGLAINMGL